MIENYWKRFVASVIRLKHRLLTDLFASAQLRITILYIFVGTLTYVLTGFYVDSATRRVFSELAQVPVDLQGVRDYTMFSELMRVSWIIRLVGLVVFIAVAYFLSEITLRPAKKAHHEQRRFIANVSHELRTPLSVLKTSSEVALLAGKNLTREQAIDVLKSNIEEVDRMSKIIQFFLSFSTSQNKIDRLQMSAVNLSQITAKAINILQKRAGEKDVTLHLVDKGAAVVYGNVTALEEMLLNIIKNAITYTPRGGEIEVSLKHTFDEVLLSVRDNGLGIPPEDIPHIFEPFFKASNTIAKKEGVGLGLAIVKEIAHMHRAHIDVKSKVGKGTIFSIHFHKR